jgi:hypothetical protein
MVSNLEVRLEPTEFTLAMMDDRNARGDQAIFNSGGA